MSFWQTLNNAKKEEEENDVSLDMKLYLYVRRTIFTWTHKTCQIHYNLIAHPHLLVHATNEQFLPVGVIFRVDLANENHWMWPMLIGTAH